jgi:DNA-binding PadR family transcriptional regulator
VCGWQTRLVNAVEEVELSLTELVVLALAAEGTTHGWALARTLAPDGEVGVIWTVHRALVYRAVGRLTAAGLLREKGLAPGHRGPNRTLVSVTARGRRTVSAWLDTPVAHVRDMRAEFLVKLALLHRVDRERATLVARQREVLAPIARQLGAQLQGAEGFDAVLARWRVESSDAALRFLDALRADPDP